MDFKMDSFASLAAGGAILGTIFGVIVRGWETIKNTFNRFFGIFFVTIELDDQDTSKIVLSYLLKNYKRSNYGNRIFSGRHNPFRDGKFGHVSYEIFGNQTICFWDGSIPFWFKVKKQEENSEKIIYWRKPEPTFKASILIMRFTIDVESIIENSSKSRNDLYWSNLDKNYKRFFVKKIPNPDEEGERRFSAGTSLEWFNEGTVRLLGHNAEDLGRSTNSEGKAVDNLYFPPRIRALIEEVKIWHSLRHWYEKRSIPWKRGWCLYGPPGTGKTALVRAIAEDLDMPLFVYSLGRLTDTDLERSWNEMQTHTPCIALFEDFDTVFHGRENVYGKPSLSEQIQNTAVQGLTPAADSSGAINRGQLNFGCLLNCIDGADKSNGIFLVMTTNHIEKLDPALGKPTINSDGSVDFISTRPGRIDKAIELGYMEEEEKIQFAKKIFSEDEKGLKIMLKRIKESPKKETPAQFQESCTQLALELLWKENQTFSLNVSEMIQNISENNIVDKAISG